MTEKIKKEKTKAVAEKSKKGSDAKQIFILMIVILLVASVAGAGICYYLATKPALPEAPETFTSEEELYNTISSGILKGGSTTISEEDLNGALAIAKNSINKNMEKANRNITVNQLFGELKNSQLTVYSNFTKGERSFDLTFTAEIDYTYPEAYIYVSSIKVGKLSIPVKSFMKKLSSYPMPDNISVSGRRFIYNTSNLNDKLIELIKGNKTVNNAEDAVSSIFEFFGIKIDTDKIVDNFLNDHVEFKITNMKIDGSKIKIESDLFK